MTASNIAASAANIALTSSNTLYPQAAFGSNVGAWGSNIVVTASNTLYPQAAFASNTAYWASNNGGTWASNTAYWASNNGGTWASNTAYWASNTAISGSNVAVSASNSAVWASNLAVWTSNNATTGWSANSNGIYVSSSNLGLGTSTPAYKLDVVGSMRIFNSNPDIILQCSNNALSNAGSILFQNSGGNYTTRIGRRNGTNNPNLVFSTGLSTDYETLTDVLTLTSGGYLGVGTSAPASKLDVVGDINTSATLRSVTLSNSGTLQVGGALTTPYLSASSNATSASIIIGNMDAYGTNYNTGQFSMNNIGTANATLSWSMWGMGYGGLTMDTSANLYPSWNLLGNIGKPTMQWSGIFARDGIFSGNVGIGTTSPAYKLDVAGDVRITSAIYVDTGHFVTGATLVLNCAPGTSILLRENVAANNINSYANLAQFSKSGHGFYINNNLVFNINGSGIAPSVDNAYTCGTNGARWLSVWAQNGTIQTSDSNEKDFVPLSYGLSNLLQVSTIQYKWKSQASLSNDDPAKNYEYYGVIANELDAIFPELVYNQQQPYQINYSELIPVCINAIKELKHAMDAKDVAMSNLLARIEKVEANIV